MATTTSVLGLEKPTYQESQDVTVINSNADKLDAEAGRVRANFAGTYSSSSAYAVGDYCIYQGNLYRCTTAIGSGGEAWNSSHWAQVAFGNRVRNLENSIASMPTFKTLSASSTGTTFNTLKNSRFILDFITTATGSCGTATCYVNASGVATVQKVAGLSNITFGTSTENKLTISGANVTFYARIYQGDITA